MEAKLYKVKSNLHHEEKFIVTSSIDKAVEMYFELVPKLDLNEVTIKVEVITKINQIKTYEDIKS